jgi:hypothetical protein
VRISLLATVLGALAAQGEALAVVVPVFESGPVLGLNQICVTPSVKTGDIITNSGGDTLTILAIRNGLFEKNKCAEEKTPVLAEARYSESPSFHSTVQVDVPAKFDKKLLAERDKFAQFRVIATLRFGYIWFTLKSWDRHKSQPLDVIVERARMAEAAVPDTTLSPTEVLDVHGAAARRWETTYKPKGIAPNFSYLNTIIEGTDEIAVVSVWGQTVVFNRVRAELPSIAESVRWPAAAEATNEAPMRQDADPQSTAPGASGPAPNLGAPPMQQR